MRSEYEIYSLDWQKSWVKNSGTIIKYKMPLKKARVYNDQNMTTNKQDEDNYSNESVFSLSSSL